MESLYPVLAIAFVAAIVIVSLLWQSNRSQSIMEEWAHTNGFQILEAKYAAFFQGPFFLTTSKGQTVYRVLVQDRAGHIRRGWVRCGSWWGGLMSDNIDVRWDD